MRNIYGRGKRKVYDVSGRYFVRSNSSLRRERKNEREGAARSTAYTATTKPLSLCRVVSEVRINKQVPYIRIAASWQLERDSILLLSRGNGKLPGKKGKLKRKRSELNSAGFSRTRRITGTRDISVYISLDRFCLFFIYFRHQNLCFFLCFFFSR